MEKIARAQAVTQNDERLSMFENSKKVVELNPNHPFIKELLEKVKAGADKETEELAETLYDVGMINTGYYISDTTKFSSRMFKVMSDFMGLSRTAKEEEIDVTDIIDPAESADVKTDKEPEADISFDQTETSTPEEVVSEEL